MLNKGSKTLLETFKRGFKNASYMSIGNLISQLIGFVGIVFIARLFGPDKFGVYATVIAYVMFFHLFVVLGLSKVIVREGCKDLGSFEHILNNTIGLRLIFIILAFVVCLGAVFFTNYPDYTKLLIIIFSSEIIYFGLDSFFNAIYQTKEKMQYIAIFSVMTRTLITGLSVLFLYIGAGILIILLVNLLSRFLVLFINYFWTRRLVRFRFNLNFLAKTDIIKQTIVFSLIGFINYFAIKIDLLMISLMSTSSDVGIYSVAHEIAREGLILRNITATAFFPVAVKLINQAQLKIKNIYKYSVSLFLIVSAGCVILFFFAQDIIALFFGGEYMYSGFILQYLIFYLPFTFYSLPLTTFLQASHNESVLVIIFSIAAAINIPLNILFFHKFGLVGIAYSTILVFAGESIMLTLLTLKKFKKLQSLNP